MNQQKPRRNCMKKMTLSLLLISPLLTESLRANDEAAIPCPEPKTELSAKTKTKIRLPLLQCLMRPQALIKCPAALAACALTVFKATELIEGLYSDGWEGKKWHTVNLLFEAIVMGYVADWFLKSFLKSCEKEVIATIKTN